MKVSCCCLTYGRNALLAEAVESFRRQDYPAKELLVFNTLATQELRCDVPGVRVINQVPRPKTLGATRNMAIAECAGEFVLTWDDDDIYLPTYVSWLMAHRADGWEWVRQGSRLNMERWSITSLTGQATNQTLFSKAAWQRANGYPEDMDSGEDRIFSGRLQQVAGGELVPCKPEEIGFLYGWDNGAFHVSGCGENQPGKRTALEGARRHVEKTERRRGRIQIVPRWKKDYVKLAAKWVKEQSLTMR